MKYFALSFFVCRGRCSVPPHGPYEKKSLNDSRIFITSGFGQPIRQGPYSRRSYEKMIREQFSLKILASDRAHWKKATPRIW